jgi:uncharacterized alpha-E superfamily protein
MDRNERREYMTPEDAERKAGHAKQLLEDPLLKDSLAANVNAAIAACSQVRDEKEAWRACMNLKAVMDATRSIASHIETGKIIAHNFRPTLKERMGF